MDLHSITVELTDCASDHGAVALIAPLGIDTEFQKSVSLELPAGWTTTIVAEPRTGQRAAVLEPPDPKAAARLVHRFAQVEGQLASNAYAPEGTPLTIAAAELATEARDIAARAGGGLAGIAAVVADTARRFDYGYVPPNERWYYGQDAIPAVACVAGDCVDINTFLVAALRAAGYEAAYLTCYFFDENPDGIASGMHCWVRTRQDGVTQDWDIAHFKKVGRNDVSPMLNPVPGRRFALAYGRDHAYPWRGAAIRLSTPSRPMWVMADGSTLWGKPPIVQLTVTGPERTCA